MPEGERTLDDLRREIDRIDSAIHDLLMQRTAVVHEVSRTKRSVQASGAQFFRPGREAQVLRRLVARHSGAFPQGSLIRIWREIMSGQLRVQTELSVAVSAAPGLWDLARDQYGAAARYQAFTRARQVVAAVRGGDAGIGVVPLPGEDDGEEPWWPALADSADAPRILSRLPVIGNGERSAFAIGRGEPDSSGRDRACLIVDGQGRSATEVAAALAGAGIVAHPLATAHGGRLHLLEADGLLLQDDPRLGIAAAACGPVTPIGGYAVPIDLGISVQTEVA